MQILYICSHSALHMKTRRIFSSLAALLVPSLFFMIAMGQGGPPVGGTPPCWPPPCIPIDGGVGFLIAAGAALGLRNALKSKSESAK